MFLKCLRREKTHPPATRLCSDVIQRLVHGVYPVCLSHMHNTAGGSLHRRVYNSNKSSALFRREVEQLGAAGRGSAAGIMWLCLQPPRHCRQLWSTQTLLTSSSVTGRLRPCLLRVWHHLFTSLHLAYHQNMEELWSPVHVWKQIRFGGDQIKYFEHHCEIGHFSTWKQSGILRGWIFIRVVLFGVDPDERIWWIVVSLEDCVALAEV